VVQVLRADLSYLEVKDMIGLFHARRAGAASAHLIWKIARTITLTLFAS